MKLTLFFLITFLSLNFSWAAITLEDFKATDVVTDQEQGFTFPSKEKYSVMIFVSAQCPCSASHEGLLKDLKKDFKDFAFIGVHANANESTEIAKAHFQATQFPFPVIQDKKSLLANKLGALKTPHAFVLNAQGTVLYAGGVTDSHVGPSAKKHYLREVLEDLQAGKQPRHKEGRALGCYIQREDE
ncbi:MAG: redoxin domain-containing protein [Bdellovibrio sp.]|nr:redoxin domain-containing protein [Bdellovibrio sp.]